jgi:hypothetical protein
VLRELRAILARVWRAGEPGTEKSVYLKNPPRYWRCVVVRIPSFARRSEATTATEDRNRDGQIDERDEPTRTTDTRRVAVRDQVDDRGPRPRTAAGTATVAPTETRREPAADRTVVAAPAGPRPRASMLATIGLVIGVAAALTVLTGVLAGYGIALGIAGLLLSIGGLSATGKRHVAGKSDALLGMALNVGAMVVGALALTGALPWLTTETDKVEQLRQWLDTQFADRF